MFFVCYKQIIIHPSKSSATHTHTHSMWAHLLALKRAKYLLVSWLANQRFSVFVPCDIGFRLQKSEKEEVFSTTFTFTFYLLAFFLLCTRRRLPASPLRARAASLWRIDVRQFLSPSPPNNGAYTKPTSKILLKKIKMRARAHNILENFLQTQQANIFNDMEALKQRPWLSFCRCFFSILYFSYKKGRWEKRGT